MKSFNYLFSFFVLVASFSCSSENKSEQENQIRTASDSIVNAPHPKQKVTRASAETNGLRMTTEIRGDTIVFAYENTSPARFCLWTETKGYSLTWNYVQLNITDARSVTIEFDSMEREHSGLPVSVWLEPGESYSIRENLQEVIQSALIRKQIGVEPGEYTIDAFYDSGKGPLDRVGAEDLKTEHWKGKLKVEGLQFVLKPLALK